MNYRGLPRRGAQRHDGFMRVPWTKSKVEQLDLVDSASAEPIQGLIANAADEVVDPQTYAPTPALSLDALAAEGLPLLVPVDCLEEDPSNPRTEFPDEEIGELARDIALRGILQPIVVRPAAEAGRYRILFGAKRLRAAKRAGLEAVQVVIGSEAHDVYAQVAENQKRHGLTPLDLAKFMRSRADAGDSNAEIAKRMGIDLTSVAHHLALLILPPELDEALRSGRCRSPRTLYELAKLQKTKPERVKAIVTGEGEITRSAVASLKKAPRSPRGAPRKAAASRRPTSLVGQANDLCARLETLLDRIAKPGSSATSDELAALRQRLARLGSV
jgi:ParB family chromosome partitioning protein